jgi:hypothetical protein
MDQFLTRVWEDLLGRTEGPLTLRLLLQPVVSAILAIRAGLKDAREGQPPYFWALAFNPDHRHQLLRQGWKDTGKIYGRCQLVAC